MKASTHRICYPCRCIPRRGRLVVERAGAGDGWCCFCRDWVEEGDDGAYFSQANETKIGCADLHADPESHRALTQEAPR